MHKIPIGRMPIFEVQGIGLKKLTESRRKKKHRLEAYKQGLRVKNYDLTTIAGGHLSYRQNLQKVLETIEFSG